MLATINLPNKKEEKNLPNLMNNDSKEPQEQDNYSSSSSEKYNWCWDSVEVHIQNLEWKDPKKNSKIIYIRHMIEFCMVCLYWLVSTGKIMTTVACVENQRQETIWFDVPGRHEKFGEEKQCQKLETKCSIWIQSLN